MKHITSLCLIMFALSACDAPERPITEGNIKGSFFADLFTKRCTIEILFGSYASGIDQPSYDQIKALIDGQDGNFAMAEKPWGREGETALCIDSKDADAAAKLEEEIATIIAANEPTKGPVTVTRGPLLK